MLACLLVLLHTLVHSSFVAAPAPKTPIRFNLICKLGAAATYCCARLRVARANRAVTVFAVYGVSLPTLCSGLCRVHSVVPPCIHTARHCLSQARAVSHSLRFVSLHSVLSFQHFLSRQNASKQKTPPALRQSHRQSKPSLRSGLPSSATLAPLADGSRLSTTQTKKLLRYCSACFLPLRSGSRLLYLFPV